MAVNTSASYILVESSMDPVVWDTLGVALVLADAFDDAYAAFLISIELYRKLGFMHGFNHLSRFFTLETPWLRKRCEILRARARVMLLSEKATDEDRKAAAQPWPEDPGPEAPPASK